MKASTLFLLPFAAVFSLAANAQKTRVINNPLTGYSSDYALEFSKIEVSDTATVVHANIVLEDDGWVRFDSTAELRGGGKAYRIKGADGITLNKKLDVPASGTKSFRLIFPPVDKNLTKVDFIECANEDCFRVFDIDLTGKAKPADFPDGLPAEVRNQKFDTKSPLPEPVLEIGQTTVRVHLLGWRPEMSDRVNLILLSFFPNERKEYNATLNTQTGVAEFSFQQYGSNGCILYCGNIGLTNIYLNPGEAADIYVDLAAASRYKVAEEHKRKPNYSHQRAYFKGDFAELNTALQLHPINIYGWGVGMKDGLKMDGFASGEAYTNYIINKYQAETNAAKKDKTLSVSARELLLCQLQYDAAFALQQGQFNYREQNNSYPRRLSQQQKDFLSKLNLDTPKLAYLAFAVIQVGAISTDHAYWSAIKKAKGGFLSDLIFAHKLPEKIEYFGSIKRWKENLTTDTLDSNIWGTDTSLEKGYGYNLNEGYNLDSVHNPFFAKTCAALEAKMAAASTATAEKTDNRVMETSDKVNEQLLDSIAALYKGKAVLVDLWATWCGPCRAAINATEPLKDNVLKLDNLAFVYITTTSSPEKLWKTMIADIKGDHYRVSEAQWKYLVGKQLNIDGIPSYVLIQKDGTYQLRNDLRDHDKLVQVLQEAANK